MNSGTNRILGRVPHAWRTGKARLVPGNDLSDPVADYATAEYNALEQEAL